MIDVRADVVIVGSGAGGGTVAQRLGALTQAGRRVIVLEQGPRLAGPDFTGNEVDMAPVLYQDGGGVMTADGTMTLAFGRLYGGSTVVYTGTSLPPPKRVIDEWGVPGLGHGDLFDRTVGYARENGVHLYPDEEINENNRLFVKGCQEAGYEAHQFPVNTRGCRGSSLCNLGCPNGAKQGTHEVQLPSAESQGVEVVTRAEVVRVEERAVVVRVEASNASAKGAPSEWEPGQYRISAEMVVVAGGSVGSTALLLRSGYAGRGLPKLGAGFTCHPAFILVGEHGRAITNDVGHPKSFYVDRAEDEGFILETCMYFPFITAKNLTGFGPEHAQLMNAFSQLQMILVLACDKRDEGNRITVDRDGNPVVHYSFTQPVRESMTAATRAAARIFFAAGAERVHAPPADPPLLERTEIAQIDTRIDVRHFLPGRLSISAAHLMGGCGMGADASDSVTDASGRVHGHPWLRVADSALFPDSIEINPYLTVMSLADRVADGVIADLAKGNRISVKLTGGAIVTRALEDEGIDLAFGIPGTHNIELYDALAESDFVRTVLVTDEQSASFMADGAWRASGRMACVNLVPGAGLTHAMSGIAEAFLDHVPMLVLGCGIRRDVRRAFQLHDVDQQGIARPVVKQTYLPETGDELYGTIREACRVARSGAPGPVFVEVPVNLYLFKHEVELPDREEEEAAPLHETIEDGLLTQAVELIQAADRPLLYVGAGAVDATEEVMRLAELLDAPVSTTFQGKGVFPEDHPLFLWPGFGYTAPSFVRRIADQCDLTIAVGCRFSEVGTGSYALEPRGDLIHIDIDPAALNANFEAQVAIQGDAGHALRGLIEALGDRHRAYNETRREDIRSGHAAVWEDWLDDVGGELVTPAHLLRTAQAVFGPDAIYTTDSGNGTFLALECLRLAQPRRFLAPVDYSCMGYSVPAALGAKLARPEQPVVALAGDGAFLMTGLEILTAVQEGIGAIILVLRDRELAQIAQFQSTAMNRKTASAVHDYEVEHLAAGMHASFFHLTNDDMVEATLREADAIAQQGKPVLIDVAIDYGRKTYFTKGVVKANLNRLPFKDRARFIGRAVIRRFTE